MKDVFEGVRRIDALYRVSTRAQESEGESLFNQKRAIREWAREHGVTIGREVCQSESGKSALQLVENGFRFSRRDEYARMIADYQRGIDVPDAVCVDWDDRWNRDTFELTGTLKVFRKLGIRLLSIANGKDLTDPDAELETTIISAVAQNQLRVVSDKVRENRRSRRERARWQGGRAADGYRTHAPDCPGRSSITRTGPDGVARSFTVRSCSCPTDVLYRDPAREPFILAVWALLARSPLSWAGMADALNDAGHRRRSGKPLTWRDVDRIGKNPHYAGVMTSEVWEKDREGRFARMKPLAHASLRPAEGSIVGPYVSEDEFWRIHKLRYEGERRHLRRGTRGGSNELLGIMMCPGCQTPMTSLYALSNKRCGSGYARKAPRKKYAYLTCALAKKDPGGCRLGRKRFKVEQLGQALVQQLAATATMSDSAIMRALQLREPGQPRKTLQREQAKVEAAIGENDTTRRFLQRERAVGRITDDEYQRDLFELRRVTDQLKRRLEELRSSLRTTRARPSFTLVRQTVSWLAENWAILTVPERAEALRLLVTRVTIDLDGRPRVLEYGPGFVDAATDVRLGAAL